MYQLLSAQELVILTSLSAYPYFANLGWPFFFHTSHLGESLQTSAAVRCVSSFTAAFGPRDLIHLLYSCSVAKRPQAGGGLGFNDSPPPLGFGTLFLCTVISIGKEGLEFFLRQGYRNEGTPTELPPLLLVCIEWDTLSPQQTKGPCKKRGWRRWLQQAYGRLADLCIALLLPSLPPDTELSTHLAYRWASLQCKDHLLPLCIHPTSSGPTVPLASFI